MYVCVYIYMCGWFWGAHVSKCRTCLWMHRVCLGSISLDHPTLELYQIWRFPKQGDPSGFNSPILVNFTNQKQFQPAQKRLVCDCCKFWFARPSFMIWDLLKMIPNTKLYAYIYIIIYHSPNCDFTFSDSTYLMSASHGFFPVCLSLNLADLPSALSDLPYSAQMIAIF